MKRGVEQVSTYLPPTKFLRRPGSTDLGRDYEEKMTALLALHCILQKDTKDMWVGSNVDNVGDFDDIVLYRQDSENKCTAYLIQLKHQENPKNLSPHEFTYISKNATGKKKKSKEDFSLFKYEMGFLELQKAVTNTEVSCDSEVLNQLRLAQRIVFIIFTNKGVNDCELLYKTNNDDLEFLNTDGTENIFKFKQNVLNCDTSFLEELYLFTKQIHVNDAENFIRKAIKQLIGSINIDFKKVTKQFVHFMKTWIKGNTTDILFDTLSKEDIIAKLTELILDPYNVDLTKVPFTYYETSDKKMWNEIVNEKSLIIVDDDDTTYSFLKDFIGNEIKEFFHQQGIFWDTELSDKSFYMQHDVFKSQKSKFLGNRICLSPIDIYKCLWFQKKVPIFLRLHSSNDLKKIKRVLKLSNYMLKAMILYNSDDLSCLVGVPRKFVTLQDLTSKDRSKILQQSCSLQGRYFVTLKDIVNKSMYHYIKCRNIIQIILKTFSIGYNYEPLPYHFIPRNVSKIFFTQKHLKEITDDVFVIFNTTRDKYDKNEQELFKFYSSVKSNTTVIINGEKSNEELEEIKAIKNVHELYFYDDQCLELRKTHGSIQNVQHFQLIDPQNLGNFITTDFNVWQYLTDVDYLWVNVEEIIKSDFLKTIHIINANPGMGKSVLLNYLALNAPTTLWVLKINLNEHYKYYEELQTRSASHHLHYFNENNLKKYNSENFNLAQAVFEKFVKEKKVLVLFDGFDEISISFKDEVAKIAFCLHEDGYPIWITTRPIMKTFLEETFNVLSITLRPLNLAQQKIFLTEYFTQLCSDTHLIDEFVSNLLKASQVSLTDNDRQFTGIPLQLKLLADVFKVKLLQGDTKFNQKFDLLYLFEEFLKEKNNILCEKFGVGVKDMRIFFEKHQQLFALKVLFSKDQLCELDIDQQLEEYYEDEQHKIQFLQREGVVVVQQNSTGSSEKFNVNFVHQTFTEFVAAQWLVQNFNGRNEKAKEVARLLYSDRFVERYPFLYNVFDRVVTKGYPLILAVINGQIDEAKQILQTDLESLDMIDKFGRSVLHLITLYGKQHPIIYSSIRYQKVHDRMIDILDVIPNSKIIDAKDVTSLRTILDYSLLSQSFAVANKLCQKSKDLCITISTSEKFTIFSYCGAFEYKYLFKKMLPYFAYRNLLEKEVEPDTSLKEFCTLNAIELSWDNLINYASEFEVATLIELFKNKNDSNYFTDIHIASAFGTEDNMRSILSTGEDINQCDIDYNTSLHYAIIHENLAVLKLLIKEGVEINLSGCFGNTALHYASEKGNNDIIIELLKNGANINLLNNENDTPLHFALLNNNLDTAILLLDNGASVNIQNDEGDVCLHIAADFGYLEIAEKLLTKNNDAWIQNTAGRTPLHTLIQSGITNCNQIEERLKIMELLLDKGGDCNKQDILGNSPLHYVSDDNTKALHYLLGEAEKVGDTREVDEKQAAINTLKEFNTKAVALLLKKHARIDIVNPMGNTPLDEALQCTDRNETIINLLKGAACFD